MNTEPTYTVKFDSDPCGCVDCSMPYTGQTIESVLELIDTIDSESAIVTREVTTINDVLVVGGFSKNDQHIYFVNEGEMRDGTLFFKRATHVRGYDGNALNESTFEGAALPIGEYFRIVEVGV